MKRIIEKYVFDGAYSLNENEAKQLLKYYEENPYEPYADERLRRLKRVVGKIEQVRINKEEEKRKILEALKKIHLIYQRWEKQGAKKRALGNIYEIWSYGGVDFHKWQSGAHVIEIYEDVLRDDENFISMISE